MARGRSSRRIRNSRPGSRSSKPKRTQTAVIELLELGSGRTLGHVLIDFATESLRLLPLATIGDLFIFSDSTNRTLVYSLGTGKQLGHAFGTALDVTKSGSVVAVQNGPGEVALYAVPRLEKLDELTFPSEVAFARFSDDGTRLFVLTVQQTAYTLTVSAGR